MKKTLKVVLTVLGFLAIHYLMINVYIFGATIVYGIYHGVQDIELTDGALSLFISGQISYSVIFAAAVSFVIYYRIFRSKGYDFFKLTRFKKITVAQGIASVLVGLGTVFLSSLIVAAVAYVFPEAFDRFLKAIEGLEMGGFWPLFIAVVIAAPFIEEILFRGIIFDVLERRYALIVTVIIQGVLFGAYHMNLIQASYAAVLGILLGLTLIWSGTIWVPIIIHLVNNLTSTLFGIDAIYDWLEANEIAFLIISSSLLYIALPLGLFYLYWSRKPFEQRIDGLDLALEQASPITHDETVDPFAEFD